MKNAVKEQLVLQFSLIKGGNIPHISVEKEKFGSSEHQSCLASHLQLLTSIYCQRRTLISMILNKRGVKFAAL